MGPVVPALKTLALVALLASACSSGGAAATASSPHPSGCRPGNPKAGVHNPDRLQVLAACRHVTGTVVDVARQEDGDYHIWFAVDPGFEGLLNSENHFQAKPAMLAEITPDCPLSTNPPDAGAAAKCPKTPLPIPKIGDHIAIDGPWVLDVDHGWDEIHPVQAIAIG